MKIRNKRIIKVPRKIVFIQLFLLFLMLSAYNLVSISDKQVLNNFVDSELEIPALEFNTPWMNDSVHLSNSYEYVNSEITKFDLIKDYAYVLSHEDNITINNQSIIIDVHYLTDNIWENLVENEKLIFYNFQDIDLNSSIVRINFLSENRTIEYNPEDLKIRYQSYSGVNYNDYYVGNRRSPSTKSELWKSISDLPIKPLINLQSSLDWFYLSSFNIDKEELSKINKLSTLNNLFEDITNKLVSFSGYFNKTDIRNDISYPLLSYLYLDQDIIRVEYLANIISPLLILLQLITAIVFFYYIKDNFEHYQMIHKRGLSIKNIRDQVLISSVLIPLIYSLSFVFLIQYSLSFNFISNEATILDIISFTFIWIFFQTVINSYIVIKQFRKFDPNLYVERTRSSNYLLPILAILALLYFLGKGSIQYFYPEITTNTHKLDYATNFTAAILLSIYLINFQKLTTKRSITKLRGIIVSKVFNKYLLLILIISGLVLLNSFQYSRFGMEILDNEQRLENQNSDITLRFLDDVSTSINLPIDELSKIDDVIGYFPSLQSLITITSKVMTFPTHITLIDNEYLANYNCKNCFPDLLKDGNIYMEDRIMDPLGNEDFNIEDPQANTLAQIKNADLIKFDKSDVFLINIGDIIMTYQTWEDLGLEINDLPESVSHITFNINILLSNPHNVDLDEFQNSVSRVLIPIKEFNIYWTTRDTTVYFTHMINLTLIFSLLIFFISAILYFSVIINSKEFRKEIQQLLEKYNLVKDIKNIMLQINAITILFNFLAISFGLIFAYFDFSRSPDDFMNVFYPQLMGLGMQSIIQLGLTMIMITRIKAR